MCNNGYTSYNELLGSCQADIKKCPYWYWHDWQKEKYQYGHRMCMPILVLDMLCTSTGNKCSIPVLADIRKCPFWYWHDWQKEKYQYGHRMCLPILVLDMVLTSTGISEQ